MRKFRFKTEQEFRACGEWKNNCPEYWGFEMLKYLGKDLPDEFTQKCINKEKFYYESWSIRPEEYIETIVESRLNKNLLISVKEEQVKDVLEKIKSLGNEIELNAFTYTSTWCYIGYDTRNEYWCIVRKNKDFYGDGASKTFDEITFTEFMGKSALLKEFPKEGCVTLNAFYDVDNRVSKYLQKTRESTTKSSKDVLLAWNDNSYWYCQSSGKPHYAFCEIEHFLKEPVKSIDYPEYYEFIGNNSDFTTGKIYKIINPKNLEQPENFIDDTGTENGFSGINCEKFRISTLEAWEDQENNVKYVKCIKGDNSEFHNKVDKIYLVDSYDKKKELLTLVGYSNIILSINIDKPTHYNVTDYTRATKKEFDMQELEKSVVKDITTMYVKVIDKGEAYTTYPNANTLFSLTNYDKGQSPVNNAVYKVVRTCNINGTDGYIIEKNGKQYLIGQKGCTPSSSVGYYVDIAIEETTKRPFKKGDWVIITTKGASNVNAAMIEIDGKCVILPENDDKYYTMPGMTKSCSWNSGARHYRHATEDEIKEAIKEASSKLRVYPSIETYMPEIQVGDIVEGTSKDMYAITCKGWVGKVLSVHNSVLIVKALEDNDKEYTVDPKYFKKIGIYIPEEKLSTESIIIKKKVKLLPLIAVKKRTII
jgi:hypothetical protein